MVSGRLQNGQDSGASMTIEITGRTRPRTQRIRRWRWCTRGSGCIKGLGDNTRTLSIVGREGRRRRNFGRRRRGGNPREEGAVDINEEEEERFGVEGTKVRVDGTEVGGDYTRST